MKILVTNISIPKYETHLPAVYEEPPLAQVYLRGAVFYNEAITYDVEVLKNDDRYYECTRQLEGAATEWDAGIVDRNYGNSWPVKVIPIYASTAICWVSAEELKDAGDDIEQAVYEKLLQHLDVRFIYRKI